METKKCSKCGEVKPITDFYKRKNSKDGYRNHCKQCVLKDRKTYQKENREKIIIRKHKHHIKHKEEISAKNKEYRLKNRNKLLEKQRKYYYENWDKCNKRSREYYKKNSEKLKNYAKEYRKNNKDKYFEYVQANSNKIKQNNKNYAKSYALYDVYATRLTVDDSPKLAEDGKSLEVKCRYCGKYFIPTNREVQTRTQSLLNIGTESSFYCSEHCKQACPIYHKSKYPKGFKKASSREVQPQLRQLVLARDNWICQKCGNTSENDQLHCHHILPLNESPIEAADMTNCIILCKKCHKEAHKLPNCGYHELQCD